MLALAAGKLHAPLTHLRVIAGSALAVAQFKDEVVRLARRAASTISAL